MKLQQMVSTTFEAISRTIDGIARLTKLERVLAVVCLLTPAFLIWFEAGPIRGSISAYYNMEENQVFYYLLTMASMLFVVNGVVKKQHVYNIYLGVMLSGVILFNYEDHLLLHNISAVGFFGGNGVVIIVFSSKKERWFKALLVTVIGATLLGSFLFRWIPLFWAEWLSLALISIHYILESWGIID